MLMQITKEEVLTVQKAWGAAIIELGALKEGSREALKARLNRTLDELYAYDDDGPVLFKPTKAMKIPFRPNRAGAASYFIGGDPMYPEDKGFAMQPWTAVRFDNHGIILEENRAISMGHYYFTDIHGKETCVECTFGYRRDKNGHLKIDVHHSSIAYSG